MPPIMSRRSLVAAAISGVGAWLGNYVLFLTVCAGSTYSQSWYSELVILCSNLRCQETIGKACLRALPASESTYLSLARIIVDDVRFAGQNHRPPYLLAQAIRQRSRDDFREGRVATVDGWILSLTETRVYALAALLPKPYVSIS